MKRSDVPIPRILLTIAAVCCACIPAFAQNPRPTPDKPSGKTAEAVDVRVVQTPRLTLANLDKLSSKAAEVVDVTLDGPMLKLASKFLAESKDPEEAEARQIVDNLKGIYVKSYEFDKPGEYSMDDVQAIRAQLQIPGWSRIVGVASKRDGEYTDIYIMTGEGGNILGMAIISAEPEELTVVNIVGPIDINKLASIEGKMGIPQMNVEKALEKTGVRREDF
jgi:hypothetical protein